MAERLPNLPNIEPELLDLPTVEKREPAGVPNHPPRILMLYGSLRELCLWSEGQVWCSPERHGAITAVMKNQIDWIPLEMGAIRPSQGRTLAVMQVCGGSQSFNGLTDRYSERNERARKAIDRQIEKL